MIPATSRVVGGQPRHPCPLLWPAWAPATPDLGALPASKWRADRLRSDRVSARRLAQQRKNRCGRAVNVSLQSGRPCL